MTQMITNVGPQLIEALTRQEIAMLLDAIFAETPQGVVERVVERLPLDTGEIVGRIFNIDQADNLTAGGNSPEVAISLAKQEETWTRLWNDFESCIDEATLEDGQYMVQDRPWEAPDFDSYQLAKDLEAVAEKMRELVEVAFENDFFIDNGFADSLQSGEESIKSGLPEWICISEKIDLGPNLTYCLLQWEWLTSLQEEEDAFSFTTGIREWERGFAHMTLDGKTFIGFFTELPIDAQEDIFHGLTEIKDLWPFKSPMSSPRSHWHILYMRYVDQFSPERYLDNLRSTIPQQWKNGLPIIEDRLTRQQYSESMIVIQETLASLLKINRGTSEVWTPETSLLFPIVSQFGGGSEKYESHRTLLRYYRQAAEAIGETDLANVLHIQLIAFDQIFDWKVMIETFESTSIMNQVRHALCGSWQNYIIKRTKPRSYQNPYLPVKQRDITWLHWLLECAVDSSKAPAYFQSRISQWLCKLPNERRDLGEDYDLLRLLTKDLAKINSGREDEYPRFFNSVIRAKELSTVDDKARQTYLQKFAPPGLLDSVLAYWETNLQNFVPRPESAHKSNYSSHAVWMNVLKEFNPQAYETLMENWRVQHKRRLNLWKAMSELGLR